MLTASSVSSQSDRLEGSWHSWHGRGWRETGCHMKMNLPIFKDEDAKDAITYQSWRWDLMVYHCVGCRDYTLLLYTIWSLQGYPGELVQSLGMDITLDDVLTIIDKHYNNIKALNVLNQELFQLQMADKETISDWGVHLSRHLQVLAASFPKCFPANCVAELKHDHYYSGLPQCLKAMVAYLKASPQEKSYSDNLWAAREAQKEDSMELSQNPQNQTTDNTAKSRMTSFFPLQKLKGTQPAPKTPTMHLEHLGEESAKGDKEVENEDPSGINGVTKEFMVHLARAIKDPQVEEKHCYHCSSLEPFICSCPLVRSSRANMQLNCKEGMVPKKGAWTPQTKVTIPKTLLWGGSQGIGWCTQTPFLNPDPFQHWHGIENLTKVKINKESCMALLNNGVQINTIMPGYAKSHSLEMGPSTNLISKRVACIGLGNTYTWPLGYIIVKVQVDRVQGYNEEQIAPGSPRLIKFCKKNPHYLRDSHYKLHHKCHEREGDRCLGNALGECEGGPPLISTKVCSHHSKWPSLRKAPDGGVWQGGCHKENGNSRYFLLSCYNCEGRKHLHGGVHQHHDPSTANQRWLSATGSHHSKCIHQVEER